MATYTVYVPAGIGDPGRRAEQTIFVREDFSLAAFVFGPLYLLYRRLWLATLVWLAAALALALASEALGLSSLSRVALFGLLALLTGCEAGTIRQRGLTRRGYDQAALLTGLTREQAERAFFGRDGARSPPRSAPAPSAGPDHRGMAGPPEVIGLFPLPGEA